MNLSTIAKQFSWHELSFKPGPRILNVHSCHSKCNECARIKTLVSNWKGEIMEDESGIKIKEERDMTGLTLSGQNQSIETTEYLKSFADFINSENPRELLRALFCDIPETPFLDLTPDEQPEFIYKLGRCATIIKIYSQSAEVNCRNKRETLELEEQVRLKKKDQAYKIRPIEKDQEKLNVETKQEKFVNMLRSMKGSNGERAYSEEQILSMIHGEKKFNQNLK